MVNIIPRLPGNSSEVDVIAKSETSLGAKAWELMYELFKASKPHLEKVASRFDMTPQQLLAFRQLSNERPLAMSELAVMLGCDASNVTSLVDKFESRGFVERRSTGRDRRVKALVLTLAGSELRDRVEVAMQTPPPAIAALEAADQKTLCAILRRALGLVSATPGQ